MPISPTSLIHEVKCGLMIDPGPARQDGLIRQEEDPVAGSVIVLNGDPQETNRIVRCHNEVVLPVCPNAVVLNVNDKPCRIRYDGHAADLMLIAKVRIADHTAAFHPSS